MARLGNLLIIGLVVCLAYVQAKNNAPKKHDWESFKQFHGKQYESAQEEAKRRANFEKNKAAIYAHNALHEQGKVGFSKELNAFADEDPKEFARTRNGLRLPHGFKNKTRSNFVVHYGKRQAPDSLDWRDQGKVSPVKDQGQCGSCWAFSATGAVESQVLMQGQNEVSLSEQQIVDCDTSDSGCNGGSPMEAWSYIQNAPGQESESDYPYNSGDTQTAGSCSFDSSKAQQTVSGSQQLDTDEDSLKNALQQYGPLSIGVDAQDWQFASDGVLECPSNPACDHAILLIGYGADDNGPYWIIKNSWGTSWGDSGFAKVARDASKDCGVTSCFAAVPQI
jgi:C1A family cysteine protease